MNKNVKIVVIVLAIVIACIVGYFAYDYITENDISKLEVYNYEEVENYTKCTEVEGVEFSYPSNYESIGTSTQPTFMDPEIAGASVNLVSEDSQGLSIERYMEISKNTVKQQLEVEGEITEQYINLNGVKACKIDYVAKQSGISLNITQAIIIKSGKAYILTIGCLPDDVEVMKEKTNIMLKSFK